MALEYYVTQNRITPSNDDYMAVGVNRESFTIDDVYDHMTREGSTLTKAEALAAFEEVSQGIINIIQQGNSVVTPLVNIMPSISGIFDGEGDQFDKNRHQIRINITAGLRLQAETREIPTQKVAARERQPELAHFFDQTSEAQDQEITAGGGARITGKLLKFDVDDANQGVFFVNTSDGSATRVDTGMLRNMPSELIFINPGLDPGTYRLEVRTLLDGTTALRTGTLSEELAVA